MRNSVEELNQIPPDFEDRSAKEFAPLPDEFNRSAPPPKPKRRASSTIRKVMLYLASIGAVSVGLITPIIRVNPPEQEPAPQAIVTLTPEPTPQGSAETATPVTPTPQPAETPTPQPVETPTPQPTEAPTATPTSTPVPAMTGQIHITVYSDLPDRDAMARGADYPAEILAEETFDAATFTEYTLPPLPERDGYDALCYVLLRSGGTAYLDGLHEEGAVREPIGSVMLTQKLTATKLGIVDKNSEDVYEAEIHVVWISDMPNDYLLEFYDGDTLFNSFYVWFPLDSASMFYLVPFTRPEREGKTFDGWCDADGNRIDAVTWYDFYEKLPDAQTIEDRDTTKPIPCRVYACWSDGTGGVPEPVMYTVTCRWCSFMPGGSERTGTFAAGSTVTVYGSFPATMGTIIRQAVFSVNGELYSTPYYAITTGTDGREFWFMHTFTVTGDTTVDFMR